MFYKVDTNRFRELPGLFYDDFVIDAIYEHRPGRTITEADNNWLTLLSMNQHPIHIDEQFAEKTEFGKILVNSAITFLLVNGMTVNYISFNCFANLGWDNVRFSHPVFIGDTLYAESAVLSKRLSKSRKNQGIVSIRTKGFNQDNIQVMTCDRTFLIPQKNARIHYELPNKK